MIASLYQPIFLLIVSIFCFSLSIRYISSPDFRFQENKSGIIFPLVLCIFFIFFLGLRPVNGEYFGDTFNYAYEYSNLEPGRDVYYSLMTEWFWALIMVTCKSLGFDIHIFFTIVEAGYILSVLWAVKKFIPTNPMVGILFVFSSLMFFTFGVNGIRNGLACHIVLLGIAFFLCERYWIALLLAILSFGIHRSVLLPILAVLIGRYMIKDFRYAVLIWFLAILLSLAFGNYFSEFIGSLGFDQRMSTYLINRNSEFYGNFRWDFVIYSVPPILMGWYVLVKKNIKDEWFRTLCVAYCLCNAFWVLVIRMAFTNRFAYLSWFMYPILIAYPLINLPIWSKQDKRIGIFLGSYCLFTLFMQVIYWSTNPT